MAAITWEDQVFNYQITENNFTEVLENYILNVPGTKHIIYWPIFSLKLIFRVPHQFGSVTCKNLDLLVYMNDV